MTRIEIAEETNIITVTGSKFKNEYLLSITTPHSLIIINGYPDCPECGSLLLHHIARKEWQCQECSTTWTNYSLAIALERAVRTE